MKKFLKRILGVTALEERVTALEAEKSQISANKERDVPLFGSMLNEWINGAEGGEDK